MTVFVARTDLGEENVNDALVANDSEDAAAGGQITTLGEGDQTLSQGPQALGLRLGCRDAAMLEQRRRQVGEHEALVGGTATQAGTFGRRRHDVELLVRVAWLKLLVLDQIQIVVVVFIAEVHGGAGVESGRAVLEGQSEADELDLDLVDGLCTEVANVE